MKHFICASIATLLFALPLYAQDSSSTQTTTSPESTIGSGTMGTPGSSDPQMQQDSSSSGSHRIHKKTKEVEMQEEIPSDSTSAPVDSSMSTEDMDTEE